MPAELTHVACDCPCGCLDRVRAPYPLPAWRALPRCSLCYHAGQRAHFILLLPSGARFLIYLERRRRHTPMGADYPRHDRKGVIQA